jgi:hypothetical protein
VHGLIGLVIMLLFFLWPVISGINKQPLLFTLLWALILFACFFECLFDRQHGIILIGIFWFIFRDFEPQKKLIKQL